MGLFRMDVRKCKIFAEYLVDAFLTLHVWSWNGNVA